MKKKKEEKKREKKREKRKKYPQNNLLSMSIFHRVKRKHYLPIEIGRFSTKVLKVGRSPSSSGAGHTTNIRDDV